MHHKDPRGSGYCTHHRSTTFSTYFIPHQVNFSLCAAAVELPVDPQEAGLKQAWLYF